MIVRNETANLPRCLDAVAPHIACWVIGDTGSTDGTQDFIRAYFAERGIPGELHSFPFLNFEQARNAALDHAYASPLPYDYLLFDDADMELIVDDPAFRTRLDAPGYSMMQRDDSLLAYWNVRLVRRDVRARYHGVTHEYLDAPGGSLRLPGAWYKDHASGANRTEKLARDITLLRAALQTDPDNHRTWYYLAQCYRDAGQTQDAAETFAKRAAMGGWDEEAWNARLQQARCLRKLGDAAGFVRTALEALDQRPSRAEPLYDLAHYYREIGKYDESAACAERGLAIPRPDQDILFVEDFVYTAGLQEELSIAAFYSKVPARKARGLAACERLALTRSVPQPSRDAARLNLNFYVEPLLALAPSFAPHRIAFQPPDGWRALNPSITRCGDRIVAVQRTVNYELRDDGHYVTFDGSPITTRNTLLHLNDALEITSTAEIMPPADWPPPHYELVRGFEDARLFAWRDALWCTATVRDQTPEGWCEQMLARIDGPDAGTCRLTDWRVLRPEGERKHEKNWMPLVDGDALRFIYLCDPTRLVDDTARTVAESVPPIAADEFKGGSQAIAFDDGWLAVIHEVTTHGGNRSYHHRFVWFDAAGALHKLSRRFYLQRKGVEFVAGLAWHPDARRLLLSYGVKDYETWLATVDADEVRAILPGIEALVLPRGDAGPTAMDTKPTHHIMQRTAPLVFIHAAPRTCSTWFWSKFRELPLALCFYEPFNEGNSWLTHARAARMDRHSWNSRHPPTDPYYKEYDSLISDTGGIQLFDPAMTSQWFIPDGGLRGELRSQEKEYLSQLIEHADQAAKAPVIGGWRSLGRSWAIKRAFGGFHIFQYRNLWQQWVSFLSYKRRGDMVFYVTIMDTIFRDDDPYFSYLVECGLRHAAELRAHTSQNSQSTLKWNRRYVNVARDEDKVRQLEVMPEHHVFALFMGLHIYLYLHAQLAADLEADVTRMARDGDYRTSIERAVHQHTGLAVSFADVGDIEPLDGMDVDVESINWDEIREHVRVAVRMLSAYAEPAQLMASATAFIDATIDEMRRSEGLSPVESAPLPTTAAETAQSLSPQDKPATREPGGHPRKTIGLCMIVKNEAPVILRCLNSVRPLLDYVLIEDTGSTDGTQDIIRAWLTETGTPGEVFDQPWRDFAHNRSVALARLRENSAIDYALVMDADDVMEYEPDFDPTRFKGALSADHYHVAIRLGGTKYGRTQICSNRKAYYYRGVLHEFLEGPDPKPTSDTAHGLLIVAGVEGSRSHDPGKYQRDAATLERALETETDEFMRSRYTFYLAQSYRDFGEAEKALEQYLRRADLGFWDDEVYISLHRAAQLQANLKRPVDEVLATYRRAIDVRPGRAEAIHGASHFCRLNGRNEEGYQFAKHALPLTKALPPAGLFIEPWVYEYGLLDEYAINAYWSGHYRDCLDASLQILSHSSCPESQRGRILSNAKHAVAKLQPAPNLGSLGEEHFVQQHAPVPPRQLQPHLVGSPRVLVAILAKQKEPSLPLYLECIEALDYPKSSIVLYIRTNNNTDGTERILREWVARVGHLYAGVEFDAEDVAVRVEQFGVHEWNATRFNVLGRIRNISLGRVPERDCDFYFVSDVDNFVRPNTLRELVALDLPIVAPFLRSIAPDSFYSNFHAEIDANGYYKNCDQYQWILNRWIRGVVEVPVVHCTYLIRADVLNDLTYEDGTSRHEYVIFSDSARRSTIPQYLDNRQVYGFITFGEDDSHHVVGGIEKARAQLGIDLQTSHHREPATRHDRAPAMDNALTSQASTVRTAQEGQIREKFSEIYQKNEWGYGSGVGSLPINNIRYIEFVQAFVEDCGIKSVVDFGCGDWQFSQFIDWRGASYVGVDLVPSVIEANRRAFARPGVSFEIFKTLDEPPSGDLLLCKDVFQHLPNDIVREYLAAFKQKFKFLLITNDDRPESLMNEDIQAGGWRPIRLDQPPFSERAPVILAWMITYGGWKPTHKATCLINGNRDGGRRPVVDRPTVSADPRMQLSNGYQDSSVDVAFGDPPGHGVAGTGQPDLDGRQRKRFIRLKEFPPSSDISCAPSESYVAGRDSTLIRRAYQIRTDQDGFILPRSGGRKGAQKLVIIGDSVVESMFNEPERRFCSKLEDILCDDLGLSVTVLNAGYSGATILHSFNVFLNKIIALQPTAVILMTGMVDVDVACLRAGYWSKDCWVEPVVDMSKTNSWRDHDILSRPTFDDRAKILDLFAKASGLFGVPLWYATVPHRQVFSGEYVQKTFNDKLDFDRQVILRRQMNDVTRRFAISIGQPLFDFEHDLADRSDIFYDMFHLNALGNDTIAHGFVGHGIGDRLKEQDNSIFRSSLAVGAEAAQRGTTCHAGLSKSLRMPQQIHLINLDQSTDRLAKFRERNPHLRDIVRVSAIDGSLVNRRELVTAGTITDDLPYTPGALGCALSHVEIWKQAASQNEVVTVFEDDVICSHEFSAHSQRILSGLPPDWDIIQWGYSFDPLYIWLDFGFSKANIRFYDGRFAHAHEEFQRERFSSVAVRLVHSFGLQAYSVSPKGARALLDNCLPLRRRVIPFPGTGIVSADTGIDIAMCAAYSSMQAFLCIPPLVIHDTMQVSDRLARERSEQAPVT